MATGFTDAPVRNPQEFLRNVVLSERSLLFEWWLMLGALMVLFGVAIGFVEVRQWSVGGFAALAQMKAGPDSPVSGYVEQMMKTVDRAAMPHGWPRYENATHWPPGSRSPVWGTEKRRWCALSPMSHGR